MAKIPQIAQIIFMENSPPQILIAPLTTWYIRRMLLLFLMFSGLSAYFYYDWQVGYPKKAEIYKEYLSYREKGEEGLREWAKVSAEKGISFEDNKTMAPFKADEGKIKEQYYGMLVCLVGSVLILIFYIKSHGTQLRVEGNTLHLPHMPPVDIADVVRVDTRKWLGKGLAYVWVKHKGSEKKVALDGLKYGGFKGEKPFLPDLILERVVQNFRGELIELQEESPEVETTETENKVS